MANFVRKKKVFMEQNQTSRLPGKHPKSSERVSSFWLLWGHLAKQRLRYCSQLFFSNFLVKHIGMFQQGDNFSTMEIPAWEIPIGNVLAPRCFGIEIFQHRDFTALGSSWKFCPGAVRGTEISPCINVHVL